MRDGGVFPNMDIAVAFPGAINKKSGSQLFKAGQQV
jgi:hypothetical protein